MRRLLPGLLFAAVLILGTAVAGLSHHAFSPVYDDTRQISVTGVVTQFKFVNPHAMMLWM
jgi:hypothetical protein